MRFEGFSAWTVFLLSVSYLVVHVYSEESTGPISCKVVEGNHVYDLSELSARDYWHSVEHLHTANTKEYFISICHPLRNGPLECPGKNSSAACSVTIPSNGSRIFENIGDVPSTFQVDDMGKLTYSFDSGEECMYRNRKESYKTEIHFICPPGDSSTVDGPVLMSSPGCYRYFAWMTKAACPKKLKSENVTTCIGNFPNSTHLVNLHTLHSPTYYNVSSNDGNYEINICGPVTNGHCGQNATVCKLDSSSSSEVMGVVDNMELAWNKTEQSFDLIYKYNSGSVKIQFFCDRYATTLQIYYHSPGIFYARTDAVCLPGLPQCVITDAKGNVYDLRPLYKAEGNWKVVSDSDGQKTLYHINICGEVNDERFYHCPPGPIGACETSIGASSAYNLGFLTSNPVVNEDRTITVSYKGGDPCKNGQHTRSTRITLVCDKSMEREPVLEDVTETCEYNFYWHTPAACPRHNNVGSECKVSDPLYGNLYDLTSLRKKTRDYNVSDGVHSYLMNICGPLITPCDGNNTSSVCQVKGNLQYSAGLASSNITFNDGTITMRFTNGSDSGCEDDVARSSHIIFMCDHDADGSDGPDFVHEESCTYHFIWRTREACPPFQVVDCSYVTSDGTFYDLSELSSSIMNEEYFSPDHSKKYVLNVCRSVVHSKESRCPYKSAACIVDLKNNNESINIGEVISGPSLENGRLQLSYRGGDECKHNSSIQSETIIEFICDMDELYPYPQLIAEEKCKYVFEWATPVACPVTNPITTTSGLGQGRDCKVTSPVTGITFDLNSLKKDTGYDIHGDGDFHLILNVCDQIKSGRCSEENQGACAFNTDAISHAGKANANLHYLPGFLFLKYEGGAKCQNGLQRSTLINFICGAEGSPQVPILVHDDLNNCTYHVNWHTELVCERKINCFVNTWERRINLTPLIRKTGNYEASNPNNTQEKFYLNVCRPLNQIIGIPCHPGSAACLVNNSSPSSPLNLGHPNVTPVNTPDSVQLMYSHGSFCPADSHIVVTSKILFKCDKESGLGNPVFLQRTHDCQYQFEWKTSLVCDETEEILDSGPVCHIMFEAAKTNVDLKPLQKAGGYEVKSGNMTFIVNVCGSVCNNSGVCTTNGKNYGLSGKSELKWDYNRLHLRYFGGDRCLAATGGYRTTSIFFECDMQAGFGEPVADTVVDMFDCVAVFHWKTNVTCIEGIYSTDAPIYVPPPVDVPPVPSKSNSTLDDGGKDKSNNSNSPTSPLPNSQKSEQEQEPPHSRVIGIVAAVIVVSGIVFVLVLVLLKSHRGKHAMATARRLLGFKGYSGISQSQAESSTLLGTARIFRVDDSDDDLLRI